MLLERLPRPTRDPCPCGNCGPDEWNIEHYTDDRPRFLLLVYACGRTCLEEDLRRSGEGIPPVLSEVPSVRNGEFAKWFDALTRDEFERTWSDPELRAAIQARLRHPGGFHEWFPVSRADTFRSWGVSADQLAEWRTASSDVKFLNPAGRHGGFGSTMAHDEIIGLADSSGSSDEFVERLRQWATDRLEGGVGALPPGLRRRDGG
jgi:hypothetical protein